MATILSFAELALSMVLGAWLAILLVRLVVARLGQGAKHAALVGARWGQLSMLVPSIWFAVFLGAPLGGGAAIGAAGESAAQVGIMVGYAASLFGGLCIGGFIGLVLGMAVQGVRHAKNAT
jgi:hypothetical protein